MRKLFVYDLNNKGNMAHDKPEKNLGLKNWVRDGRDNKMKVLRLFFDGPNVKLHVREVARRVNLTPQGAWKILRSLKNEGLLESESNDIVENYWGNYNADIFIGLKRSLNLYRLYSCGMIEYLEEFYRMPECITLFGSYSRGEDVLVSDVDIVVVTDMKDYPDLTEYESYINRKISIHLVKNVKKEDNNFVNSLVNGIVLSGFLEVR